jgi:hypothetical protein
MACPYFYFVFSHVRLLLFCLRQQHCLNKSFMFLQDLLAYVILGPWSKWRYCPFCVTSLYARHVIIGWRKLKDKILDCSLTAYVSCNLILVNDQLDALFFSVLFYACTCLEQQVLIIRRTNVYQYIIWYNTLWWVTVWRAGQKVSSWPARQIVTHQSVLYQIMYWYNLILLMMSTCCSKHVEAWNKTLKKSASSWSLTRIKPRCTVSKI